LTECTVRAGAVQQNLLDASVAGRQIVRAAAVRFGGVDNLRGIKRLRHVTEGTVADGLQQPDPAKAADSPVTGTFTRTWRLDFEKQRHRRDTSLTQADGQFAWTDYYGGGKLVTVYPQTGISWARESTEAAFVDAIERYDPARVVLRALDAISTATWIGASCDTGMDADVVEFSWNARSRMRLHVARADSRTLRVEVFIADPLVTVGRRRAPIGRVASRRRCTSGAMDRGHVPPRAERRRFPSKVTFE
jgi:hypothetical protein